MSILTQLSSTEHDLVIQVSGDFIAAESFAFEEAYRSNKPPLRRYVVDMQQVKRLDPSALDILMTLRDYAKDKRCEVGIINMPDSVLDTFHVLHFHKVFKPHYEPGLRKIIWLSV
ncbi:MAG: anti-anti-sigma regulatory factor (antagonist of anti-sigma factor) [Gammaproteobacteria bacterium]|jgi:anti-anti-sigma regulatory factor|nr:anti-anti-sigma regulatory factor (antagonist of anti-sigma factor) [Gammaproteobacteria bacterium]